MVPAVRLLRAGPGDALRSSTLTPALPEPQLLVAQAKSFKQQGPVTAGHLGRTRMMGMMRAFWASILRSQASSVRE